ncbi:hypothetical protein FQN60_014873 [Etheostoma spectabile]|uniref:Uncharacterized protein n=1 Tax=Etheostoma spectabile TaxID=54343 RepID=A0A5J5CTH6_9PERO|nr:hypothetical protein FQN60_014873 [Etheostoma spectabile]
MSSAEDSGSKCSSGPISSFTIQSILGTPPDAPRSGNKELSKGPPAPPPPPRRRSLSVSSEEECSGGEDSADCFCSDTGHSEPCNQHRAHNFCLGPAKGLLSGNDGLARRPHLPQPMLQDYKEEQERPCHQIDNSLLRVPVPRSIAFPTPLYYPGSNLPALPLYNLYNKIEY